MKNLGQMLKQAQEMQAKMQQMQDMRAEAIDEEAEEARPDQIAANTKQVFHDESGGDDDDVEIIHAYGDMNGASGQIIDEDDQDEGYSQEE